MSTNYGVIDDLGEHGEVLDRCVDKSLRTVLISHIVAVRNCFASAGNNLIDDLLGWRHVSSRAIALATEIVHDNLRSVASQAQRVLTANTAACASDDCDLAFTESCHADDCMNRPGEWSERRAPTTPG